MHKWLHSQLTRMFICAMVLASFEAQAQRPNKDTTFLDFVGAGNIQRSLDNGEGIPASTGLGVVLDEYHIDHQIFGSSVDRVFFSGQINVATTDDTLSVLYKDDGTLTEPSLLGEAIMTPLVGRRAVDLNLIIYFADTIERKRKDGTVVMKPRSFTTLLSGVQVKYTGSNRIISDTTGNIKSTMNALRFRLFHDLIGEKYRTDYSVMIGGGFAYNSIRGDIAQQANEEYRKKLLGTTEVKFGGLEVFAQFRLKNIRAEFSYTWLDNSGQVPGLSGGRMVTTIAFVGGFPVRL
jgi:hypothetical protein